MARYLVRMIGGLEPELHPVPGTNRAAILKLLKSDDYDDGEGGDTFFMLHIRDGLPTVWTFSGGYVDGLRDLL